MTMTEEAKVGAGRIEQMARIRSASLFELEVPFVTPYKLAGGTYASVRIVMVKLVDADGIEGWGEANAHTTFSGESSEDTLLVLKDVLLPAVFEALDPNPGSIDRLLDRLQPKHFCAKGAVSMALLDIQGKRLRNPVSTLLGGALHTSLPVLWPLNNGTAEDDARVIDQRAAEGFATFMLKMGTSPIPDEIRRVEALEARYGDGIKFIADANQGWTYDDAVSFLEGVKGSRLTFVEQPVPKDAVGDMALLAGKTKLRLSVDESLIGLSAAANIAKLGAASVFSIKSSKNGGPLRAQRIAAVAEAFGIECYMNSMLELGVTQAASLQHAVTIEKLVDAGHAFMSTLRFAEDPTDFASFVRNGRVHFEPRPGLGLHVDEEHVRRLSVQHLTLDSTDR